VFGYELGENTELRLLEEQHAERLADLTERNRERLRTWLPWVDASRTVEDSKNFIRSTLKQFAENNGFQAGIWHEGRLAGVVGHHAINWEPPNAAPHWAAFGGSLSRVSTKKLVAMKSIRLPRGKQYEGAGVARQAGRPSRQRARPEHP
jgi:ribosomal-protein-serine acetyltransferase